MTEPRTNDLSVADAMALGYAIATMQSMRPTIAAVDKAYGYRQVEKLDRALAALDAIRTGTAAEEAYTKTIEHGG